MSQVNVNSGGAPVREDTGDRTAAAGINFATMLIVLAVVVAVLWFLLSGPIGTLFRGGDVDVKVGSEKIGQLLDILEAEDDRTRLFRHVGRELEQLRRRVAQVAESGFEFFRRGRWQDVEHLDLLLQIRGSLGNFADGKATQSLRDDDDIVVRLTEEF